MWNDTDRGNRTAGRKNGSIASPSTSKRTGSKRPNYGDTLSINHVTLDMVFWKLKHMYTFSNYSKKTNFVSITKNINLDGRTTVEAAPRRKDGRNVTVHRLQP